MYLLVEREREGKCKGPQLSVCAHAKRSGQQKGRATSQRSQQLLLLPSPAHRPCSRPLLLLPVLASHLPLTHPLPSPSIAPISHPLRSPRSHRRRRAPQVPNRRPRPHPRAALVGVARRSRPPAPPGSVLPALLRRCSPPSPAAAATTRVEEMQIGGKPRALPLRFRLATVRFQLLEDLCAEKLRFFFFGLLLCAASRLLLRRRLCSLCFLRCCGLRILSRSRTRSVCFPCLGFLLLSYHFSFARVFSSCFVIFFSYSYTSFVACHAWNHEMGTSGISSPGPGPGLIRRLLCNLPNQPFLVLNKCNDPQDTMNSVRPTSCKATIYGLLPSSAIFII
jgi:hypothetical protein